MRNLMKKVLSGSVMFGALLVLSACGSSNNTTAQNGLNACAITNTQDGTCLTQTAVCSQYGANFGQNSNGQCVQGTVNTAVAGTCTLSNTQYGCLTQTAQCSQYGVNFGQASNGMCVQGQIGTTVNTGTTIGTTVGTTGTSCQAGYVFIQSQNTCLPQGPCYVGYGWNGQYGQAAWCYQGTTSY